MLRFVSLNLLLSLTSAKRNKCPGHFGAKTGVANLCEAYFPDSNSDKIWFVKFYAPWCGHCTAMKPTWENLAKDFKNDDTIKIGGVDCDNAGNKALCGKYGVQGFPSLKTIVNGKAKAYNGARDGPALKQYITNLKGKRGSKGGSSKCQAGLFKNKVKDSISPLCSKHYPDKESSKNSWVIAFYNKEDFMASDELNRLALEFGNEPPEKSKQRKKIVKQSERIKDITGKYSVKGKVTKKAGKSKDPLAKFGAVCCDCDKEPDSTCAGMTLPHLRVFNHNKKKNFDFPLAAEKNDEDKFAAFALEKLEYVEAAGKTEL